MEAGIIGNTGRKIIMEDENGKKEEILEPEEIHTFIGWKKEGRQVMKGQKAIDSFKIWKPVVKRKDKDEDEQEMILVKAFWFKKSQTEVIK